MNIWSACIWVLLISSRWLFIRGRFILTFMSGWYVLHEAFRWRVNAPSSSFLLLLMGRMSIDARSRLLFRACMFPSSASQERFSREDTAEVHAPSADDYRSSAEDILYITQSLNTGWGSSLQRGNTLTLNCNVIKALFVSVWEVSLSQRGPVVLFGVFPFLL